MARETKPKKIDTRIPLTVALGLSEKMTPKQVSERWAIWSSKYPKDRNTLAVGVVASLDALTGIVSTYDTITSTIETLQEACSKVNLTYKISLSLLPGIGAANAAKDLLESTMSGIKDQFAEAIKKMNSVPVTLYNTLVNTLVDEDSYIY